jgi:hypothetical protein
MNTLALRRERSDRAGFFQKINLIAKIVRFLTSLLTFGISKEGMTDEIHTAETLNEDLAALTAEAEDVSSTYNSSKELQSWHFEPERSGQGDGRRIGWSVIRTVQDLLIKKFFRVSQWRVVFEWRGPPRALYVQEVFAHL